MGRCSWRLSVACYPGVTPLPIWRVVLYTEISSPPHLPQLVLRRLQQLFLPCYFVETFNAAPVPTRDHYGYIRGVRKWVRHICAACWGKSRKQEDHREVRPRVLSPTKKMISLKIDWLKILLVLVCVLTGMIPSRDC